MAGRLGIVLYWIGTIVAVPLVGMGGLILIFGKGDMLMSLVFIVPGGVIWAAGWACRYILAGE